MPAQIASLFKLQLPGGAVYCCLSGWHHVLLADFVSITMLSAAADVCVCPGYNDTMLLAMYHKRQQCHSGICNMAST